MDERDTPSVYLALYRQIRPVKVFSDVATALMRERPDFPAMAMSPAGTNVQLVYISSCAGIPAAGR